MKKTLWTAVLAAGTILSAAADAETLRSGVLPAADAIVIHAAADEQLFKAQGLDVEVIPFKSALELGAAMRAGRLDGHFGDLMNVFTQNERAFLRRGFSRRRIRARLSVPSALLSLLRPLTRSVLSRILTARRLP